MSIAVLIVDEQPVVRAGLAALVGAMSGVRLVGQAVDLEHAARLVAEHEPDIVLCEVDGEDLGQLRRLSDQSIVFVFSRVRDDRTLLNALRAGARAYLLKGAEPDDLERALHAVCAGDLVVGAGLADRVLTFFAAGRWRGPDPFPDLTARELDVLELMAQGHGIDRIAAALEVSPKTVRNHATNVFLKLRVPDRAAAIVRAREAGLGVGDGVPGPTGTNHP